MGGLEASGKVRCHKWAVNFLRQRASLRTDGVGQTISVTRLHLLVEYGPFTANRLALELLHNICADPRSMSAMIP
jgi:hypothetical protein